MSVENLTEQHMDSRLFLAPSLLDSQYDVWWLPTKYRMPSAGQTAERPTKDRAGMAPAIMDARVIDGPIEAIRSFCFGNRYYLYYQGSTYGTNTTLCIDLEEPGLPVSTLDLCPLDAHVTALGECYLLLKYSSPCLSKVQAFHQIQSDLDQTWVAGPPRIATGLFRWGKVRDRVPWYIRTGPMAKGSPTEQALWTFASLWMAWMWEEAN